LHPYAASLRPLQLRQGARHQLHDANEVGQQFAPVGDLQADQRKRAQVALHGGNRWRLPLLLQWDIARHVRVGLGPEASILSGACTVIEIRNTFTGYQRLTGDYYRRLDRTAIFGAAADIEFPFGVGRLVLAPQIHYTRWTARHYTPWWSMDELSAGVALRFRP
jgi:hypothetical protein